MQISLLIYVFGKMKKIKIVSFAKLYAELIRRISGITFMEYKA